MEEMTRAKEILEELRDLDEAPLSRVFRHLSSTDTAVAIITAFRGDFSYDENVRRNLDLASDIQNSGFGFFFIDGKFIENEGTPREREVQEDSLFITAPQERENELRNLVVKKAREFDQDSVFFKPSSESLRGVFLDKRGNVDGRITGISFNTASDIFTSLKSRPGKFTFKFEGLSTRKNWLERLAFRSREV